MTQDHISGSWYNPRWREEEEIQTKSMSEMENKELSILERDLYDLLYEDMHILKDENGNCRGSVDTSWHFDSKRHDYSAKGMNSHKHAREEENLTGKLEEVEQNVIKKDRGIEILLTKIFELEIKNTQLVRDVKNLREELEKTTFNFQDNGNIGERYVRKRLVLTSEFHEKTTEYYEEKTRLRKEISMLQQEINKIMEELNEVTFKFMHQNSDMIKLRDENLQLKKKNMDLKAEKEKAKFQPQREHMEIKQMDIHNELRQRVQELQKNVYDSKTEINQLQMDKQNLAKEITCLKERAERQASLYSKWTEEKVNNDKQIRELHFQNQALKQELKQQEYLSKKNEEKSASKVKEQEREIESLNKAVTVLRRKVNDRQNEEDLTDLTGQFQRLLQENQQITTEKKSTEEGQFELQSMNRKLQNTVSKQKQEIKEIEEKMQSLTLEKQQHFTDFKTSRDAAQKRELEVQSINRNLQNTVDKQKKEIKELDDKIQSLTMEKQHFGYFETSAQAAQKGDIELKRMNISFQTTVEKQRQEIAGLNDKMQQLLRENQLAQKRETENESLKTKLLNQNKEMDSLKVQVAELSRRLQEADRKPSHKGFDDQGLQQRLNDANKRLRVLQEELDDTKSRLSRAIGDKLTDNNPNIADLSDKNRPTKLSERYQELYDNQWTDAFEIVEKTCKSEEEAIQKLKDILTETAAFCKRNAEDQMSRIKDDFSKGQDIPANIMKPLKDCRKAVAELYGKATFEDYLSGLCSKDPGTAATLRTISPFIRECYEICWLMAVQDPPVAFGPEVPPNGKFDKDCYKAYTRNGERVEFVVWPVLLLHQGGPVLCKGVAQGFLS